MKRHIVAMISAVILAISLELIYPDMPGYMFSMFAVLSYLIVINKKW